MMKTIFVQKSVKIREDQAAWLAEHRKYNLSGLLQEALDREIIVNQEFDNTYGPENIRRKKDRGDRP